MAEERTQVVRIIFRPEAVLHPQDLEDKERRRVVRDYLSWSAAQKEPDRFPKLYPPEAFSDSAARIALLHDLVEWESEVALFLFGFLILNITMKLKELGQSKAEDEIWVTSTWGMKINRVTSKKL